MTKSNSIAAGGALATAVAFGPARMGFGLFLPQFKEQFSISTAAAGLIASTAFAAFFFALLLAGYLVARRGPRYPVALGSLAAMLGLGLVALAQNTVMVTIGTVLAASSAGLCWSPFNSAAQRGVPLVRRERALSIISTGTTVGIVGAGLLAFFVAGPDQGWRAVWLIFALFALLSALFNLYSLRRLPESGPALGHVSDFKRLAARAAVPLYAIALSFGITNGVYFSFAVDHVSEAGGLAGLTGALSGPVLFIVLGFGGVVGFVTADIQARIGLAALVRTIFLCAFVSMLLIALGPTWWAATLVSAALQGACLMMLSAIFSYWSSRLYPDLATISFTVVLSVFALGNVIGPALAGFTADAIGLSSTFAFISLASLATSLLFPKNL